MGEFVKVASANEIAPGQARLVNIKGKEIALFNIEGTFFALENACTHEEGPLAEGEVEGHEVICLGMGPDSMSAQERLSVHRPMETLRVTMCASPAVTLRLRCLLSGECDLHCVVFGSCGPTSGRGYFATRATDDVGTLCADACHIRHCRR